MGAIECCAPRGVDEAGDNCNNIDEGIDVMNKKKNVLVVESNELTESGASDKMIESFMPDNNLSNPDKRKRIIYLEQLDRGYGNCITILKENPKLPIEKTRYYLMKVCAYHDIVYDEKRKYNVVYDKLRNFAEKQEEMKDG